MQEFINRVLKLAAVKQALHAEISKGMQMDLNEVRRLKDLETKLS